ncbi:hypothetical protein BC833DRAFT_573606 [Globomyces pollinis-pini]|nr:hypothetical protein BC833DRAFT_573606 [Globomyces pollinis-pini]
MVITSSLNEEVVYDPLQLDFAQDRELYVDITTTPKFERTVVQQNSTDNKNVIKSDNNVVDIDDLQSEASEPVVERKQSVELRLKNIVKRKASFSSQRSPGSISSDANEKPKAEVPPIDTKSVDRSTDSDLYSPIYTRYVLTPSGDRFDVSSLKRNSDFHDLFPLLDTNECLIDDYTCAWFNDVLLQGRLYVSQNFIAFHSKVIWTYTVLIPLSDVKSITKKSVAGIFQTSLEIATEEKEYYFTSFVSREHAFNLMTKLIEGYPHNTLEMQQCNTPSTTLGSANSIDGRRSKSLGSMRDPNHPINLNLADDIPISLANSLSPESLTKLQHLQLNVGQKSGLAEIVSVEKNKDTSIMHQKHPVNIPSSDDLHKRPVLVMPGLPLATDPLMAQSTKKKPSPSNSIEKSNSITPTSPVSCSCLPLHKEQKLAVDVILDVSVNQAYEMLYGYQSTQEGFLRKFWEKSKYSEIAITDWVAQNDESPPNQEKSSKPPKLLSELKVGLKRTLNYIVQLSGAIGPKQTKCYVTENIHNVSQYQLCIDSSTQTPDVPSGNAFFSKLRVCLLFETPERTRMIASCSIEYVKFSWIKMALDRAVPEGVKDYHTLLIKEITGYLADKPFDSNSLQSTSAVIESAPVQAVIAPIQPIQQNTELEKLLISQQSNVLTYFKVLILLVTILIILNIFAIYLFLTTLTQNPQVNILEGMKTEL